MFQGRPAGRHTCVAAAAQVLHSQRCKVQQHIPVCPHVPAGSSSLFTLCQRLQPAGLPVLKCMVKNCSFYFQILKLLR